MTRAPRVAVILKDLNHNGIAAVAVGYSLALASHYDFTFFVGGPVSSDYDEALKDANISVVRLPHKGSSSRKYACSLAKQLRKGDFDIVHIHGSSGAAILEVCSTRFATKAAIVAHNHSVSCGNALIHRLFSPAVRRLSDAHLACSRSAGEWVFGKSDFTVMKNAFHTQRFLYDESVRRQQRQSLGIPESERVFILVGRVNAGKNHSFAFRVLEELNKMVGGCTLLAVGDGPLLEQVRELASRSECSDKIIMYGNSLQPELLYSAADALLFPSRSEGLGIAVLEAQVNGLPCIVSDVVPDEVELGGTVVRMSLGQTPQKWAERIVDLASQGELRRKALPLDVIKHYEIAECSREMAAIYDSLLKQMHSKL